MNVMFGIDCSSPSATDHFVGSDVGFHPTLYCSSPSETREHVSATAETASKLGQMNVAVRILDGIVKNRYANDPGKLAAWISASHVEKAPKKKEPPTP
jgi:hypothetical protein